MDLAEALACSRAVLFVQELSLFQVEFEGDSLQIIQAINNPGANLTLFGHVIEEIRGLCSNLHRSVFKHVQRGGNKLAHALARRAVITADFDVWIEELPNDLVDVFQSDFSLS